jgi:hypothetical protein
VEWGAKCKRRHVSQFLIENKWAVDVVLRFEVALKGWSLKLLTADVAIDVEMLPVGWQQ